MKGSAQLYEYVLQQTKELHNPEFIMKKIVMLNNY